MTLLLGLLSLAGLSLFLARVFGRSLSLMPLVALAACSLWFTLAGVAGLLWAGGLVWYAGCLAALGWVVVKEKTALLRRLTPGFVFFVAGGVFFTLLYAATNPMLTAWDEFTFWGTAAKVASEHNALYTLADSNLIARSYPPGLIVISYAMQFLGSFSEPGLMASFSFVYLAAFAACSAFLDSRKSAATLLLAALFLLPFLFETSSAAGGISWAWVTCYADPALAAVFGGALGLYFAGGRRDAGLFWMLGLALAFLVNLKDIGLALALLVWLVMLADLLLCQRAGVRFYRLAGGRAAAAGLGLMLVCIAASYAIWAAHLALLPEGINRFDLGSTGESLGMVQMLVTGVGMLFGIGRTDQYHKVFGEMIRALWARPVSLLGNGLRVLAVILVLTAFTWLLCRTRAKRRQVAWFTAAAALGFVAFYIFNIFTYALIFSEVEAFVLKDYERYIFPYWQGWLMGVLVLLSAAAARQEAPSLRWREGLARLTVLGVASGLLALVLVRGNLQANFLRISPSLFSERRDVQAVLSAATAGGMQDGDTVYIVNQYDDGTRFYMFGYEMDAHRVPLYAGTRADGGLREGTASVHLRGAGFEQVGYEIPATPALLSQYLAQQGCTHLLIDEADDVFVRLFGGMFADGLAGYKADGHIDGGPRYWRIEYTTEGCRFVPEEGRP